MTGSGHRILEQAEEIFDAVDDDVLGLLAPRHQRALDHAVRTLARAPELSPLLPQPAVTPYSGAERAMPARRDGIADALPVLLAAALGGRADPPRRWQTPARGPGRSVRRA